MERLNKEHTYLQRNQYSPYFLLIALPLLVFGGYLALAGFGAVRLIGKAYVPLPVIGFIGVMFASLGFFIAFAALRQLFRRQPPSASPYLQDYPWQTQGDSVTLHTRSLPSLLRTLFLLSFMIPVNYIVWFEDDIPLLVRAGVVLLDLLPLWMLFRTLYLLWQGLKYGRILLAYGRFPFHPGQRGTVYLTPNFLFPLQAELRYVMERREVQRSNGRTLISHHCYRLATCPVEVASLGADQPLKLTFELPSASEQVNHLTDKVRIYYWEITLKSQQSDSDFDATFLLPVYAPDAAYPALIAAAESLPMGLQRPRSLLGISLLLGLLIGVGGYAGLLQLGLSPGAVANALQQRWHAWQRQPDWQSLTPADKDMSALVSDSAGNRWVLSKYALFHYPFNQRERALLTYQTFRERYAAKMNALSSLYVAPDDTLWLGSWNGDLLRLRAGMWHHVSHRDQPLKGRIHAMTHFNDQLYIGGSDGLWLLAADEPMLVPVAGWAGHSVGALLVWKKELWIGSSKGMYRLSAAGLQAVDDGMLRDVQQLVLHQEQLYIGTRTALWRWPDQAAPLLRADVKAFFSTCDRLWIGTWKQGLYSLHDDVLEFLPPDQLMANYIAAITQSPDGELWLGHYGHGLFSAPVKSVTAALQPATTPAGFAAGSELVR